MLKFINFQNPITLLLITGVLLGFNLPLGKIAASADVPPIIWAMILSLGAIIMLFPVLIYKNILRFPKTKALRYVVISAVITYIIPNILLFMVIPHIGAGYTGLMFALSPVFTLIFAAAFKLKTPNKIGLFGILVGLIGAVTVFISHGSSVDPSKSIWILIAVFIPVILASGNIYRTMDWPKNAIPEGLAFWSHLIALAIYFPLILQTEGAVFYVELLKIPEITIIQMIVAGLMFMTYFHLQQKGGPVLLSQIGNIAAAVGLICAVFILNEHYSPLTWLGASIIGLGILITSKGQKES